MTSNRPQRRIAGLLTMILAVACQPPSEIPQDAQSVEAGTARPAVARAQPPTRGRATFSAPAAGTALPFTATGLDGEEIRLEEYRGKVVLLDFWATWCGPCIAELPNLSATYDAFHDQGLEILGISLDHDREALERYLRSNPQVRWLQIFDRDAAGPTLAGRYSVSAIPRYFLIGRDGTLLRDDAGLRGPGLRPAVAAALKEIERVDTAASGAPHLLAGQVVDGDGVPVAKAWARYRDADQDTWSDVDLTDAEGRFRLPEPPSGTFDVAIGAPGFAPRIERDLSLPPGAAEMDLGAVRLEPGHAIEGRILDPRGNGVAGAEVYAYPFGRPWLRAVRRWPAAVVTGPDGGFVIDDLPWAAKIGLHIRRRGFANVHDNIVAPPDEPLTIRLRPGADVSGTVLDARRRAVPEALIELLGAEPGDPYGGRTLSNGVGRFRVEDVAAGNYRVLVRAQGMKPSQSSLRLDEGEPADLEIVLDAGAAVVTGRILAADGRPLPDAVVNLTEEESHTVADMVKSDADGRYRLEGVGVGERTLFVQAEGYLPEIRQLEVEAGLNEIDVVFPGGVTVSGRVLSAGGVAVRGAWVSLLGGPMSATLTVYSDADGSFRFDAVPQGRYELWAATRQGGAASERRSLKLEEPVSGLELRLTVSPKR